jgi:2,5-dihydroxypyridine 5,6-dioxygenase
MYGYFSEQILAGARNCLLDCGGVKAGDQVLILSLTGDNANPVDDDAVRALAAVCQEVRARPQVLYATGMERGWWDHPSRIVMGAFTGADVVVNNTQAIGRPLRVVRQAMFEQGVTMVRNMATTAEVLASDWARFPFQVSDAIYRRMGEWFERGHSWRAVNDNGTDISGGFGPPSRTQSGLSAYNIRRGGTRNRPFPLGVCSPVTSLGANGIIVTDRTIPVEARRLGVPEFGFSEPVRITVEDNRMTHLDGGPEAPRLRLFFEEMERRIGEDAWNLSSWHAGFHPKARVPETKETGELLVHRAWHNHPRTFHFHLGGSKLKADFDYPYMWHISVEMDDTTVFVDGEKLYDCGRPTIYDDPEVRELAARFGDPDELLRPLDR